MNSGAFPCQEPGTSSIKSRCSPVRCLPIRASAKDVIELLESTPHNAFPIVDKGEKEMSVGYLPSYGRLRGLVSGIGLRRVTIVCETFL